MITITRDNLRGMSKDELINLVLELQLSKRTLMVFAEDQQKYLLERLNDLEHKIVALESIIASANHAEEKLKKWTE